MSQPPVRDADVFPGSQRRALVGLGANLGEPCATLDRAVRAMDGLLPGVRLRAVSRVWHSAPHVLEPLELPLPECLRPGGPARCAPGAWYANRVARLSCAPGVTPEALFKALMDLEADLGRNRLLESRYGPRVIDIDLLAFEGQTRSTPRLILPHPRLGARPFVLLPLREVAPEAPEARFVAGMSFIPHATVLL